LTNILDYINEYVDYRDKQNKKEPQNVYQEDDKDAPKASSNNFSFNHYLKNEKVNDNDQDKSENEIKITNYNSIKCYRVIFIFIEFLEASDFISLNFEV